jgi:hypothetical protein
MATLAVKQLYPMRCLIGTVETGMCLLNCRTPVEGAEMDNNAFNASTMTRLIACLEQAFNRPSMNSSQPHEMYAPPSRMQLFDKWVYVSKNLTNVFLALVCPVEYPSYTAEILLSVFEHVFVSECKTNLKLRHVVETVCSTSVAGEDAYTTQETMSASQVEPTTLECLLHLQNDCMLPLLTDPANDLWLEPLVSLPAVSNCVLFRWRRNPNGSIEAKADDTPMILHRFQEKPDIRALALCDAFQDCVRRIHDDNDPSHARLFEHFSPGSYIRGDGGADSTPFGGDAVMIVEKLSPSPFGIALVCDTSRHNTPTDDILRGLDLCTRRIRDAYTFLHTNSTAGEQSIPRNDADECLQVEDNKADMACVANVSQSKIMTPAPPPRRECRSSGSAHKRSSIRSSRTTLKEVPGGNLRATAPVNLVTEKKKSILTVGFSGDSPTIAAGSGARAVAQIRGHGGD